jgi:hypothetical protein
MFHPEWTQSPHTLDTVHRLLLCPGAPLMRPFAADGRVAVQSAVSVSDLMPFLQSY